MSSQDTSESNDGDGAVGSFSAGEMDSDLSEDGMGKNSPFTEVNTSDTTEPEDNGSETETEEDIQKSLGASFTEEKSHEELVSTNELLRSELALKMEKLTELRAMQGSIDTENQRLALELENLVKGLPQAKIALMGEIEKQKQLSRVLWGRLQVLRSGIQDVNEMVRILISQVNPDEDKNSEQSSKATPPSTSEFPKPNPPRYQVELVLEKVASPPKSAIAIPKKTAPARPKKMAENGNHGVDQTKSHLGHYCTCGAQLTKRSGLINHIRYFTFPRHFICSVEQCGKRYYTTASLRCHLKARHRLHYEGGQGCRQCGNVFSTRMQLYQHCKTVHNCGPLLRNWRKGNGAVPPTNPKTPEVHGVKVVDRKAHHFVCLCDVSFKTNWTLQKHIRLKLGQEQQTCRLCSQTFLRYDYLKKHLKRKHNLATDNAGLVCWICGEAGFSSEYDVTRHRKAAHGMRKIPEGKKDIVPST